MTTVRALEVILSRLRFDTGTTRALRSHLTWEREKAAREAAHEADA